jgi:hypothetical protein
MSKPKGIKKSKVGFSIDIETNILLEKYCEENSINKSKLINRIINKFLKEKMVLSENDKFLSIKN